MRVVWHEAECGGYTADLSLWEQLADRCDAPALELGCGTGRVALHLARRGHPVSGLDLDPELVASFAARAGGLPASATVGDARSFELGRQFGLVLAPMQLLQLFEDGADRRSCLGRTARHLGAGGLAAFAIVEELSAPAEGPPPLPDTREIDGWVYSSLPVDVAAGAEVIRVRRLRQAVSPAGELSEALDEVSLHTLDAATVEAEAADTGLQPAGRLVVPPTDAHVGSTVVLLQKGA